MAARGWFYPAAVTRRGRPASLLFRLETDLGYALEASSVSRDQAGYELICP
jgi:hypothetical protein